MSDLPTTSNVTNSDSSLGYSGLAYFSPYDRSVGGILAEVTLVESHRDDLVITEHPVEQGAPIGDHAFKRPTEVSITMGWSAARAGDISDSGMYGILLAWQAAVNPFEIFTGKRKYSDMLISSIAVETTNESENSLIAHVICRQVIIVSTETETISGFSNDSTAHVDPNETAKQVDKSNQQINEAFERTKDNLFGAVDPYDYSTKEFSFN